MRVAVLVSFVSTGLLIAFASAMWDRSAAWAEPRVAPSASRFGQGGGELITLASEMVDGRQQLILIDPKTLVMGVYHVEKVTGQIALKSVRNVQWDLRIDEYNSADPAPREIRAMLENRK